MIKQLLLEQKQSDWEGYDLAKVDLASMLETGEADFLGKARGKNLRALNRFLTNMILAEVRRKKERAASYKYMLRDHLKD